MATSGNIQKIDVTGSIIDNESGIDKIECKWKDSDEIYTELTLPKDEESLEIHNKFRKKHPTIPVVLVPTTYSKYTETELYSNGANIVIYANHLLRSAYKSMVEVATKILNDERVTKATIDIFIK